MKYLLSVVLFFLFSSCTKFLIGERKLTCNEFTPCIKPYHSNMNENMIFYVIPLNKIKECRGYPKIVYIGSEKSFSMFCLVTKLAYKNEITAFALPDSLCLINTPDSIVKASSHSADNKSAKIENDRMVVED